MQGYAKDIAPVEVHSPLSEDNHPMILARNPILGRRGLFKTCEALFGAHHHCYELANAIVGRKCIRLVESVVDLTPAKAVIEHALLVV